MLGAEACWLQALQLGGGDDERWATLSNLAMVEDVLSREAPRSSPCTSLLCALLTPVGPLPGDTS